MTGKKIDPIRKTDNEARRIAAELMARAAYGTLAVLEPGTGMPLASRIATMMDPGGRVVFLASDLSFHSQALAVDRRASVLLGEPGKGDPLAHPRITLIGRVEKLHTDDPGLAAIRDAWLRIHPKAGLYIDFADFHFYRLACEKAHLNAGFGKAYVLGPADLPNMAK